MIKLYKSKYEYDAQSFNNGSDVLGLGTPVVVEAGKLKASTTPDFVTLQPCLADEKECIVHRINADELYSMPLSADGSALAVGDVVAITVDGKATATKGDAGLKIEEFATETKAAGEVVIGRFVK